jgi:small neutral amino acid transporter SnatA (MarC family)
MLFGKMDEKPGRSPEEGRDLAVFPLAVPSIAGGSNDGCNRPNR